MARRGFTLVELLVVIAIIGILVGLLLPAVQMARESGRRTSCLNNVRQFALAAQQHAGTYTVFPNSGFGNMEWPSFNAALNPQVGDRQGAGWGYQILPFIEQENVWRGNPGTTIFTKRAKAIGAAIPIYFCPSRRPPAMNPNSPLSQGIGSGLIDYCAATSYVGANGTATTREITSITLDLGIDCAIVRNRNTGGQMSSPRPGTYSIAPSGIRDGLSNTLMFGEKQMNLAKLAASIEDDHGYAGGHDIDNIRSCFKPPVRDFTNLNENMANRDMIFGSSHGAGIIISLCDGSTRLLTYTVDATTFQNLCNRRDGNAVVLD